MRRLAGVLTAVMVFGGAQVPPHPLGDAVQRGDLATVRSLLMNRTDPNETLPNGLSALHLAAARGHLEIAKHLIDAGARLEAKAGPGGCTPLHVAAAAARTDLVGLLLFVRADKDAVTSSGGLTALHLAAQAQNGEGVVRELIRRGADVDVRDGSEGRTPLALAAGAGRAAAVRELLAAGADSASLGGAGDARVDPALCGPSQPSR